jgi:hypothetical protein
MSRDTRAWTAIAAATAASTAVVCLCFWLVGGTGWVGFAAAISAAGILAAAWYVLSGRSLDSALEIRERLVERHYVGVAWYASMLRTTASKGGYERGLRAEMTRLAGARLAERHGVNLYQDPATARDLIGHDLWPLVDPRGRPQPGSAPALVPMRAVVALVERLEQL